MRRRGKEAASALQAQARFQRLTDSNIIGVHIANIHGDILEANDAFLRIIGFTRRDLVSGKVQWDKMTPPEWRALDRRAVQQLKETGAAPPWEKEYIRKDGRRAPVLIGVASIPEGPGMCICYTMDLTERKRAERRLTGQYAIVKVLAESATLEEAAPKLLSALCEGLGWVLGGLWQLNPQENRLRCTHTWSVPGIPTASFVQMSKALSFPRGIGLPGRVWAERRPSWIPDVTRDVNFPRRQEAARVGLYGAFGFPIVFEGRTLGVLEFFSRHIEEPDEELLRMMSAAGSQIGQFIHRGQAEQAAREAQALLRKEAMHREFTANVSHELRTPVAAIKGCAETLRSGGIDDPRHRMKFIQIIERHANRLSRLVEKMLQISALDSEARRPNAKPVELGRHLRRFLGGLAPLAKPMNLTIRISAPKGLMVAMDPGMLDQLLQSLGENAIAYNRPNGLIQIQCRPEKDRVLLSVRDTGVGIPKKDMEHIFERFRRGSGARGQKSDGIGLGLAIAAGIVRSHQGRIWAESTRGKGSTFYCTLPLWTEGLGPLKRSR